MKLATLKPRIACKVPALAQSLGNPDATPRMAGRALQDRRARWFARFPLCVQCQAGGITLPVPMATQLDHIIPLELGGPDDETNLQGLCDAHHAIKTRAEAGDRARRMRGMA